MKNGMKPLIAALAILISGSLLSGCHPPMGPPSPEELAAFLEKRFNKVLSKLGTTEEQDEKIAAITRRITEDALETHKQFKEDHGRSMIELLSDNPEVQALHDKVDQRSLAITGFIHRTLDRLLEINAILTPEQRIKLKERMEKAHSRFHS